MALEAALGAPAQPKLAPSNTLLEKLKRNMQAVRACGGMLCVPVLHG